jgi:hypothetical protein
VGRPLRWAIHEALRRGPALLPGTLLYALLMGLAALGGTALFVLAGLGLAQRAPVGPSPDELAHLVAARSLDAVLLEPLPPLAELFTATRSGLLRQIWQPDSPAPLEVKWLAYRLGVRGSMPLHSPAPEFEALLPYAGVALLSLTLLITSETLLCFRAAAAMQMDPSPGLAKYSILAPLIGSVQLGLRHFWPVMLSTCTLRLGVSAIQITCLLLPVAIADNVVLPHLSWISGAPGVGLLCRLASGMGGVMVNALLTAFCALYDARLFAALQHVGRSRTAGALVARAPQPSLRSGHSSGLGQLS